MIENKYVPIMSAIREIGTATSVDQIFVPSGRAARHAQSACFLADHRDSISASLVAEENDWQLDERARSLAARTLASMASLVPENLPRRYVLRY